MRWCHKILNTQLEPSKLLKQVVSPQSLAYLFLLFYGSPFSAWSWLVSTSEILLQNEMPHLVNFTTSHCFNLWYAIFMIYTFTNHNSVMCLPTIYICPTLPIPHKKFLLTWLIYNTTQYFVCSNFSSKSSPKKSYLASKFLLLKSVINY